MENNTILPERIRTVALPKEVLTVTYGNTLFINSLLTPEQRAEIIEELQKMA